MRRRVWLLVHSRQEAAYFSDGHGCPRPLPTASQRLAQHVFHSPRLDGVERPSALGTPQPLRIKMGLDGLPTLVNARRTSERNVGGRIFMTKSTLLFLIGLFVAVPLGAAWAQTGGINQRNQEPPPFQSISPARSPCGPGSQSVRVCTNDFQSCNSACSAVFISDPSADISGCTQRCCNNFSACLSIRGCSNLTSLDCFSPTSPSVRALRGGVR
jgi:hypothetical protein